MYRALVGLGSNLGDRVATLAAAVTALGVTPGIIVQVTSSWHQTSPVGGPAGQLPFLNGAVLLETSLGPEALLDELQRIETSLGRRREAHWGPRTLDLDLLLHDDQVIDTPRLVVPHPWLAVRRFVLEPAVEVAADWLHPQIGWTLERLLSHLNTAPNYLALCGLPGVGKTAAARQLAAARGIRWLGDPIAENLVTLPHPDPTGPFWPAEIEFLAKRQQMLAAETWEPTQAWAVSDFWLGQGLAYAALRLSAEDLSRYRELWQVAANAVIAPKLLALLDPPQEINAERNRLRNEIAALAMHRGCGPVLRLRETDSAKIAAQLSAAIDAMQ
jgi:2-amino-4-hydroxy-6-hydroxymethyldihydropteridine diphosphokinase